MAQHLHFLYGVYKPTYMSCSVQSWQALDIHGLSDLLQPTNPISNFVCNDLHRCAITSAADVAGNLPVQDALHLAHYSHTSTSYVPVEHRLVFILHNTCRSSLQHDDDEARKPSLFSSSFRANLLTEAVF